MKTEGREGMPEGAPDGASENEPKAFLDAAHLPETLARLDVLIEASEDVEKVRAGLGMRLALSMAAEIRAGKPLGSETSALVAEWTERYGADTVDRAVGVARAFLTKPEELAREFAARLGLKGG